MPQYGFGAGELFGIPAGANPTPVKFGVLQGVNVDFSFDAKELYGQYQFPVAVARGKGKVGGKANFAQINGAAYNSLFFNVASSVGQLLVASGEAGTVPGTPYQITVANSAQFAEDLGVIDASTGLPFTRVASAPATGQYSVSAGVYTFAAADTTKAVLISYTYNYTTSGVKMTLSNQLMGQAPNFAMILTSMFNSKRVTLKLNACVSNKLTMAMKAEDFMVPDFDFSAFADAAGNLGTLSTAE